MSSDLTAGEEFSINSSPVCCVLTSRPGALPLHHLIFPVLRVQRLRPGGQRQRAKDFSWAWGVEERAEVKKGRDSIQPVNQGLFSAQLSLQPRQ